jgi:hypothetical protein
VRHLKWQLHASLSNQLRGTNPGFSSSDAVCIRRSVPAVADEVTGHRIWGLRPDLGKDSQKRQSASPITRVRQKYDRTVDKMANEYHGKLQTRIGKTRRMPRCFGGGIR